MPRGRPKKTAQKNKPSQTYLDKVGLELQSNQSRLSMVLGALIVIVIGVLVFNYFNKSKPSLGPAQQTGQEQDVTSENLPGKYTIKEGDTLFTIAEKYYQDGSKFEEIAKANNLSDVNSIETGQTLQIPKLTTAEAMISSPSPTASPEVSESPTASLMLSPLPSTSPAETSDLGTGGANTTIWGTKIEGETYTVVEGDWLSTIAARAYGDIFAYKKLAEANSIPNPDYIVPGQVLKIPR